MVTTSPVVQQNGAAKIKRPVPPGIQTNGIASSNSSPSPSMSAKKPPTSAKQAPNSASDRSITASTVRPVNRARRENSSQAAGRNSRNSAGMRTGSFSVDAGAKDDGPPPYVVTSQYILSKHSGKPPSLVVHLHATHFRFDGQDGMFPYKSPMGKFIEHLRARTLPHDILEYLIEAKVPFYDGCLIVQIHDHKSLAQTTKAVTKASRTSNAVLPSSIHNYNQCLTPSPYVPFPKEEQVTENGIASKDTDNSKQSPEEEKDKESVTAPTQPSESTTTKEAAKPKIFTAVLHPTPESLQADLKIKATTPKGDGKGVNDTPSLAPPSTPLSLVPPTPTASSMPPPANKRQKKERMDFRKLWALKSELERRSADDEESLLDHCPHLSKLVWTGMTSEGLREITTGLESFNSTISYLSVATYEEDSSEPANKWEKHEIQVVTEAETCSQKATVLRNRLCETSRACRSHHLVMIQLNNIPSRDVLFSSCVNENKWREAICEISLDDKPVDRDPNKPEGFPLAELCGTINSSRHKQLHIKCYASTASYKYTDGATILKSNPTITLHDLLKQRSSDQECMLMPPALSKMRLKALSVTLAKSLLTLFGSRWLQSGWNTGSIFFMYDPTTNEVVDITNPYIQFSFDSMSSGDFPANGQHSYIHVFSFGLMLLELELGHQIAITAEDENDADEEYPPVYMALLRIFHSRKDDLDDPYIREVINSCLDFENRVEGIKHRAFSDHLRPRAALLRYIVQPLVNRLRAAHPDVSFDLINGPQQSIRAGFPHPASNHTGLSRAKVQHRTSTLQQFPGNSASLRMSSAQPHFIRSQSESGRQNALNKHATLVSNTVSVAGHALSASKKPKNDHPRSTEMAISLFDERTELISETDKSVRLASTFFDLFEKFRRHMQPAHGRCRVKIAVLDTGIDTAQCGLQLRREAIITDRETAEPSVNGDPVKATRSFIGPPDDTNDVCSHGTHIAEILLRLAPEADLYIAKISNYLHVDKVDQIAEAVNWALEHGCDIISMSFGMNPSLVPEASLFNVQNAIHRAATARKIMFAAASNCGGNGPRAYPASDPSVICTHAADGNGYDGGINPPKGDHADYFSTLGMAIGCIWDERCVYKSGTSFATPVAAAIAANVLDYAAYSVAAGKLTDQRYRELRQSQGMKKAFTKFLSVQMQHYRYVAPWHFWKTGVTDDYIWQRLKVDLTP